MRTLALQNNKNLILAGILAFLFLLATQISVQAYDFVGDSRTVKTIGGHGILTIGNSSFDSSLNIGTGPLITTEPVTNFNTDAMGSTTMTLHATIPNTGESNTVYVHWQYGPGGTFNSITPEITASGPGSYSYNVVGYNQVGQAAFSYRAIVRVGTSSVYGDTMTYIVKVGGEGLVGVALMLLIVILIMGVKRSA